MEIKTINANELHALRSSTPQVLMLDVRTPGEFNQVRAEGARLMPLDQLDPESVRNACAGDGPVYLLCQSGNRAKQAAAKLAAAGLEAVVVEGGTQAWESAGLPVKRGRRMISLERQVRIGAGTLVVLGVVLGFLAHPGFFILSAFVGAGLVFAGVTGLCGMALVLARLPWNQARVDPAEMVCAGRAPRTATA
jgi:rhodanese-related sulfurtransferase